MRIKMFLVSFFAAVTSAAASAADELPKTCGDAGDELCVDDDEDGFFVNAKEKGEKDCDDDEVTVYPAARLVIGDGLDNDCNNTNDDVERVEAVTAAGDGDAEAPKAIAFDAIIGSCLNEGDYASEAGKFVWAWVDGKGYTCTVPKGWGYSRTAGVQTPADLRSARAASAASRKADAAKATADTALAILKGNDENEGLVAIVGGIARTVYGVDRDGDGRTELPGLIDSLDGLQEELYGVDTDGDGRVDVKGMKAELTELRGQMVGLRTWAFGADGTADDKGGIDGEVKDLKDAGTPIFGIVPGVTVLSGRPQFEYDGGPMIRGSTGTGFTVGVVGGLGWSGHQLYGEVAFGQGSRASGNGKLPMTLGYFAVGHEWIGANGALGPELVITGSAIGNPMTPVVSSWGMGGGLKGELFLTPPTANWRVGLALRADVVAESFGTNDDWDTGAGFVGSAGLEFVRGPTR